MPWLIPIVLHYSNYMYICICCIPESIATGPVFGIFFKCFFFNISCQVFADNFMRREVQSFVVHCTFTDDGCPWKGEVRHLEVNG